MSGLKGCLLALDTSTRQVGLAIYDGTRVVSETIWTSQDYHTVELAPAVADLLAKSHLSARELGALGVAIGPGSFTGLRIGLALAKGMALAQNLPLIGVPTFDILAAALPVQNFPLAAVIQAGRGRLAVGWYRAVGGAWQPTETAPAVFTPTELLEQLEKPTLVCGELSADERLLFGRKRSKAILTTPAQSVRRPSVLAELAWQRWHNNDTDDPTSLSPIYLHYATPIPSPIHEGPRNGG